MAKTNPQATKKAVVENKAQVTAPKAAVKVTPKAPIKPFASSNYFMFGQLNYILMGLGLVVIVIGFVLMSGGATTDPNVFPASEIYSARRITIAPIVVILGFLIELAAILYKAPVKEVE
jgi:hypothetical protein